MSRCHGVVLAGLVAGGCFVFLVSDVVRAQDPLDSATLAPQSSAARAGEVESVRSDTPAQQRPERKVQAKPEFIHKTPHEWRGLLSKVQFAVTREKWTEPPYTGKYATGHFKGTFVCVCCDAAHVQSELFSSQTKFDSGTGWPSFYQAVNNKAVQTAWDYSGPEPRMEVVCRRCGAHLGHVFDDGPPPTGLRFCINSAAIKLGSSQTMAGKNRVADTSSSKTKAKAKPKSVTKPSLADPKANDSDSPAPTDHVPAAGAAKDSSSS